MVMRVIAHQHTSWGFCGSLRACLQTHHPAPAQHLPGRLLALTPLCLSAAVPLRSSPPSANLGGRLSRDGGGSGSDPQAQGEARSSDGNTRQLRRNNEVSDDRASSATTASAAGATQLGGRVRRHTGGASDSEPSGSTHGNVCTGSVGLRAAHGSGLLPSSIGKRHSSQLADGARHDQFTYRRDRGSGSPRPEDDSGVFPGSHPANGDGSEAHSVRWSRLEPRRSRRGTSGAGGGGRGRGDRGGHGSRAGGIKASYDARRINRAIIDAASGRRYRDIFKVVVQHSAHLNYVNVATALHRLASCGLQPGSREVGQLLADPRFTQLERLAGHHLPSFGGREVANCLWALAKLGYQQPAAADGGVLQGNYGVHGGSSLVLVESLSARVADVAQGSTAQEVSQSLWALGTIGHHPGEAPLQALTGRLLQVLPEARPHEVTNSFLGWAKLGWSPGPDVLDQVAHGSVDKIGEFKPQDLSITLWSLARLGHCNNKLQDAVFGQALVRISEFNPQGIANLVWAATKLGLGPGEGSRGSSGDARPGFMPEQLLRTCCDRAVATLQDFSSQNVSNLLWSLAKLGYRHEPLLRAAARFAAQQLATESEGRAIAGMPVRHHLWSGHDVANIIWAYATLGVDPGAEFLMQVCRHLSCRRCLARYGWQAMANTLWALAVLQHRDPRALAAVEEEVMARSQPSQPQNVSNLLWAYATLQHPAPGLFAALLPALEQRMNEFSGQQIANSLWAAARLGVYDGRLMDAVAEHLLYRHGVSALDLQPIANIMWAYGELQHAHRPLFDQLVARAVAHVPYTQHMPNTGVASFMQSQELVSVCAAAGIFGWCYPALVDAVESYAHGVLRCSRGSFGHGKDEQWYGHVLHSSQQSEEPDRQGGAGLAAALQSSAPRLQITEPRQVCTLAWGLSLVGGCSPALWGQLMELMERSLEVLGHPEEGGAEKRKDEELSQLYQAHMHIRMDHPTAILAPGPPALLSEAEQAWRWMALQNVRVSSFQREVAAALTRLGLSHMEERLTDDGLFSIDLAIELDGEGETVAESSTRGRSQASRATNTANAGHNVHTSSSSSGGVLHAKMLLPGRAKALRCTTARSRSQSKASNGRTKKKLLRIAVEVDGPSHFTANTRQPLATTLYRHRCLAERGWHVVSVPFWRWNEIPAGDPSGRDALLATLMREAGVGELLLLGMEGGAGGGGAAGAVTSGPGNPC